MKNLLADFVRDKPSLIRLFFPIAFTYAFYYIFYSFADESTRIVSNTVLRETFEKLGRSEEDE
jgi:hypothetical protein